MTDTNYNDGEWHGWNGGECPVHPKTEVEVALVSATGTAEARRVARPAGDIMWGIEPLTVVAFRVTKEHKKPREWWICGDRHFDSQMSAHSFFATYPEKGCPVHVREVIGDDT